MTKNLNDRVLEAKAIASLGKISQRDKHNRVSVVTVPGSEGTLNQVIIRRHDNCIISTECRKHASTYGFNTCKGNLSGFCRHSIAAIIIAMNDAGYKPLFRTNSIVAGKLAVAKHETALEFDGEPAVFTLRSWQSKSAKPIFMVAIDQTAEELSNAD